MHQYSNIKKYTSYLILYNEVKFYYQFCVFVVFIAIIIKSIWNENKDMYQISDFQKKYLKKKSYNFLI